MYLLVSKLLLFFLSYLKNVFTCHMSHVFFFSILFYFIVHVIVSYHFLSSFITYKILKHQNSQISTDHNLNADHSITYNDHITKMTSRITRNWEIFIHNHYYEYEVYRFREKINSKMNYKMFHWLKISHTKMSYI